MSIVCCSIDEKLLQKHVDENSILVEEKKELQDMINILIETIQENEEELKHYKNTNQHIARFLRQFRSKLALFIKDKFDLDSLDFGYSYSLYEDLGNTLLKRELVHGIRETQHLPEIVSIDDSTCTIAEAYQENGKMIMRDQMVSCCLTLSNGKRWIVNLHMDDSTKEELNIEEKIGRINVEILYDLIQICLELITKYELKSNITNQGEVANHEG